MKPVILNAGDPKCIHMEKVNGDNIGTCSKCGRKISYDYGEYSEVRPTAYGRLKTDILPYDIGKGARWENY